MSKQKILVYVTVLWFLMNYPFIPFAGSIVRAFTMEYFSDQRIALASITFAGFIIMSILSKVLTNKLLNAPVFISFAIFIWTALELVVVQDIIFRHRSLVLWGMFVFLVSMVCVGAIKVMRRNLNKKI